MLAETGSVMVRQTLEKKAAVLKDSKKHRKWQDLHKNVWRSLGYTRVPNLHPLVKKIQEQWPMTARECDVLNHTVLRQAPTPGDVLVADLSQSLGRIPTALNKATCITPNSKLVAIFASDFEAVGEAEVIKSRPLLGVELLQLQGVCLGHVPNPRALNNFTSKEMGKLAGNAFSASQLSVAFLVALDVLGDFMPRNKDQLKALQAKLKTKRLPGRFNKPTFIAQRSEIFTRMKVKVLLHVSV